MSDPAIRVDRTGTSLLRAERQRQELSMRELAHFAGCSHGTIQRLENRTLDVRPAVKARIARALRVSVTELWPNPAHENGEGPAEGRAFRESAPQPHAEGRVNDDST
jgi:transcriptional regulator with XRE-family HTH domain